MIRDMEQRRGGYSPPPDGDDTYVRSRVEDRSWWVRSAYMLEKYRVLVYLLVSILLALGYRFETPAGVVESNRKVLQAEIDTLRIQQFHTELESRETSDMTTFIARYICASMSEADRYRLGGTDVCATAAHTNQR